MTSEPGEHQRPLQLMRPALQASQEACAVQPPARSLQLVSAPQTQLLHPSHCPCSQQECLKSCMGYCLLQEASMPQDSSAQIDDKHLPAPASICEGSHTALQFSCSNPEQSLPSSGHLQKLLQKACCNLTAWRLHLSCPGDQACTTHTTTQHSARAMGFRADVYTCACHGCKIARPLLLPSGS